MRSRMLIWFTLVSLICAFGTASAETVKLRLAIIDSNKMPKNVVEEIIEPFKKAHPNYELELVDFYAWNIDKIMVETAAGVVADVFIAYNDAAVLSVRNGFLLDLTPYIERDGFQSTVKDFLPPTVELLSRDGHLYGFPQYQAVGGMFYNTQILAESGIAPPNNNWTWKEFAQIAQRLTRRQDETVTVRGYTQFRSWLWFFPWMVQAGVDFKDPNSVPLNHPGAIQAVDFVREMMQNGSTEWATATNFANGKSAMIHSGSWELPNFMKNKLPVGVVAPPRGPIRQATFANTDVIAISRETKHPNEAWEFLKWLYSRDVQRQYMLKTGLQPARLSLGALWAESVRELFHSNGAPEVVNLMTFVNNTAFAMPQPFFANARVISEDIMPAIEKSVKQQVPTATALQAAYETATQKLKQDTK